MPIEILEMIVKAQVADNTSVDQHKAENLKTGNKKENKVLQEAVEQALEIFKRKNER